MFDQLIFKTWHCRSLAEQGETADVRQSLIDLPLMPATYFAPIPTLFDPIEKTHTSQGISMISGFDSLQFHAKTAPGQRCWSRALAGLLLVCIASASWAQNVAPPAANVAALPLTAIEGKTLDGKPFTLSMLRGKVVLVMFWSTGCAVCRDKMPELRENYAGWSGKPFELVAVNTDARSQDFMDYERIVASTVPARQRFVQLWAGESSYTDSFGKHAQLPEAFLIDKNGKVVERYVGRIPAETWDRIADLL